MPARYLCVSVTFLQPTCHARLGREEAALNEWPPSPLRLFQAMVAGAAARWAGDGDSTRAALTAEAPVAALRWLESLCATAPPAILAPRAVTGQAVPRYVPNNSADLVAAKWARGDALVTFEDRTKKVFRPTHLLDGSTVHYVWPLTETQQLEVRRHESSIGAAARCIVALGWGIDAAVGDARIIDDSEAERLAGERWTPGRVGTPGLRVPVPGTLDALIDRHARFLDRLRDGVFNPVPALRAFATAAYRRASNLPPRPFAAFALRPLDPDARSPWRAFRQERAVCVAAMIRHAAWEVAKADLDLDSRGQPRPRAWRTQEWAEQFVAGHGPRKADGRFVDNNWPRFSYLPLPTIDPRDVVGMIRRVLIAEPLPHLGGDGRSAAWAANRLGGMRLRDEQTGHDTAVLEQLRDGDAVLARYVARDNPAREWVSVTPVILPGYDDAKSAKRQRLLRECLVHAGYDEAVESIEARPAAWLPGCVPTQLFRRPAYLRYLPALHMHIRFRAPMTGPVAVGAGRHCGLGVLAAYREDKV